MIDVRMGEHDRIELPRVERKGTPVSRFLSPSTLEHAALEDDA